MNLIIQISKGLLRDLRMRRLIMSICILIAAGMLFAGMTFLSAVLIADPATFLAYWCGCGSLTLLAMLLAIYDMLILRIQARRTKRELKSRVLGVNDDDSQE